MVGPREHGVLHGSGARPDVTAHRRRGNTVHAAAPAWAVDEYSQLHGILDHGLPVQRAGQHNHDVLHGRGAIAGACQLHGWHRSDLYGETTALEYTVECRDMHRIGDHRLRLHGTGEYHHDVVHGGRTFDSAELHRGDGSAVHGLGSAVRIVGVRIDVHAIGNE